MTLDSSLSERPKRDSDEAAARHHTATLESKQGKKRKVHSLIDKVFSRKNLELAWEKVKRNRGSAGIDKVTVEQFETRKEEYLALLHGSNVKVVFRDFQLRENDRFVVRAVGTVRTPEVFQGPVEIIKKKPPKATDSPDFHRPGSFHSPRRPLKLKRAPVHAGALDLSHQLFSYGVEPNVYRSE